MALSFRNKEMEGINHFENLFKDLARWSIQKILEAVSKYESVIFDEMKQALEEEVTKEEVKATIFSMQRVKTIVQMAS